MVQQIVQFTKVFHFPSARQIAVNHSLLNKDPQPIV